MNGDIDLTMWTPEDGISFEDWQAMRDAQLNPGKQDEPQATQWTSLICGLDLGDRSGFTALSIVEVRESAGRYEKFYYVRGQKRFPLHSTYTKIADRLSNVNRQLTSSNTNVTWGIDFGGPGPGVYEILERKMPRADIYKVLSTGGNTSTWDGHEIRVSKKILISTLVAAFDADHVFLPATSREIENLKTELSTFEVHLSANTGGETYGGSIESGHWDLLSSLALAVYIGSELGARGPTIW